ncbi:MAG: hypothetical protein KKC19_02715 [Nanoarchaeota archaeon]|nr:hypothetical protein [Nanoarchaeota archaeon]
MNMEQSKILRVIFSVVLVIFLVYVLAFTSISNRIIDKIGISWWLGICSILLLAITFFLVKINGGDNNFKFSENTFPVLIRSIAVIALLYIWMGWIILIPLISSKPNIWNDIILSLVILVIVFFTFKKSNPSKK